MSVADVIYDAPAGTQLTSGELKTAVAARLNGAPLAREEAPQDRNVDDWEKVTEGVGALVG